ncbi:MAG: peptide chain release factor 2 [bacterium]
MLKRGGYFDLAAKGKEIVSIEKEMTEKSFWQDRELAAQKAQRLKELKEEIETWDEIEKELLDLLELAKVAQIESDEKLEKEINLKAQELKKRFEKLEFFILFSGSYDKNNAILSIHAGTGGVEAQDWAEMLLRMYLRFCEKKGWRANLVNETRGQEAGIKSATLHIFGQFSYGWLKSEAGVHRLVRISPFDAEKMRHTSFALVEVLPEFPETESSSLKIKEEDLKIDTFRSSGHGGQSVNTTDSAVRIVHLPTKITVVCQNERSQLQNKETAFKILRSKLYHLKLEEKHRERAKLRGEVLAAQWGNQIRSYVLQPYQLIKDHRTDYEETDAKVVLDGEIEGFVESYLKYLKK